MVKVDKKLNKMQQEIIAFRKERKGTYVSTTHEMTVKEYCSISEWLPNKFNNFIILKHHKQHPTKAGKISLTIIY